MKTYGIKVCAQEIEVIKNDPLKRWEGYWGYKTKWYTVMFYTGILRTNKYDAEHDAILDAQKYSKKEGVTLITEGYVV